VLASIPVFIGILTYYFLGSWAYKTMFTQGQKLIDQYISEGSLGSAVYFITMTLLTILLYFVISWTFVLLVSLIASPFNDLLSSRIEKKMKGEKQLNVNESVNHFFKNLMRTLGTEVLKISFIITLSLFAFLFSYIPILTPLSIFLSMLLLSIEFLDYSWSRHQMSFKGCFRDLRVNVLGYGLGGCFFFVIITLPIINLIVPSFATSYFTVLWFKNNKEM
jgi:CysZ protein